MSTRPRTTRPRSSYVSGRGKYYVPRAPRSSVPRRRVAGRGGYKVFDAVELGQGLGSALGAAAGNMIAPGIGMAPGAAAGRALGKAAGQAFRSITGHGDYKIESNSILFPDQTVPSFGPDSIRVRRREYVADIGVTTAFTALNLSINPGLDTTFPWLSRLAANYSQYHINGLIWEFVSTSSDAIASTTNLGLGQVILSTSYDAVAPPYLNAVQALGSHFSNSGKPSTNISHALECASSETAQKLYYIRTGEAPPGADLRLYDMANVQLATVNAPANYTGAGQLWVSYDVTLTKAVQNNQLGYALNTDKLVGVNPFIGTGYFGTTYEWDPQSDLGCSISPLGQTIILPATLGSGYYLLNYVVWGTAALVTEPNYVMTNCSWVTAWNGDTSPVMTNSGDPSPKLIVQRIFRIDGPNASIGFTAAVMPTAPTRVDLMIAQLNGALYL